MWTVAPGTGPPGPMTAPPSLALPCSRTVDVVGVPSTAGSGRPARLAGSVVGGGKVTSEAPRGGRRCGTVALARPRYIRAPMAITGTRTRTIVAVVIHEWM